MPRIKESVPPEPIIEDASETYYRAKKILGEKKARGITQYLIDWEGEDPETGKAYEPTWEPADFVTEDLVEEWLQREATNLGKKRKRNEVESSLVVSSDSPRHVENVAERPRKKLKRGRKNPTPEPEPLPEPESRQSRDPSRRPRQIPDPEDDTSVVEVNTSLALNDKTKDNRETLAKQQGLVLTVDGLTNSDASDQSTSGQSSITQVFVPDVDNEPSEVSVVIPALNEFINLKHLAKRVIPDSQSFNDSTSTESQKQLSAPTHIPSSLPQPTQDDPQAPPSSFVQESDPITAATASQLVQEILPASSAIQQVDIEEAAIEEARPISEDEHENIADYEPQLIAVDSLPQLQPQSQAPQTIASPKDTRSTPSKSQEEVLAQSENTPVIEHTQPSQKQQAVDSGSEESQDALCSQSVHNHTSQTRRDSNELFHSDRPLSPPLPIAEETTTSQDSTHSQKATTYPSITAIAPNEVSAEAVASGRKEEEKKTSVLENNMTKPFDSQETVSQVTPQKRDINKPSVGASAENIADRALQHTGEIASHETTTSIQEPEPPLKRLKPMLHPDLTQQPDLPQELSPGQILAQSTAENISHLNTAYAPSLPLTAETTTKEQKLSPRRNLWAEYKRRQSLSHQSSFTPFRYSQANLNNMSDIQTSSSIPAAPSQLPDTLISQTLPPRPATPSSHGSSVINDGIPISQALSQAASQVASRAPSQAPSRAPSQAPSRAPSQAPSTQNTPRLSFQERRALAREKAHKAFLEAEQARLASKSSTPAPGQYVKDPALAVDRHTTSTQSHTTSTQYQAQTQDLVTVPTKTAGYISEELDGQKIERIEPNIQLNAQTTAVTPMIVPQAPAARLPVRKPLDLYVPIALPPELSKLYASIFDRQGELIEAFVNDIPSPIAVSRQIEDVIEQANNACFHSDAIVDGPLTQMELDDSSQLAWDIQQSPKLAVLDSLLKDARHLEKHIVFVVKSGRILTLLERFLRASRITYSCPEDNTIFNASTSLTVTIMIHDGGNHIVNRADLVIGLDKTFDITSCQVTQVRKQLNNDLCPTITLLVPFTIEHLTRALTTSLTGDAFLRSLVSGAAHLRKQVGDLQFEPEFSRDVGKQLALMLTGSRTVSTAVPSAKAIPFPDINLSPLRDFGSLDRDGQATATKRPNADSTIDEQPTLKRSRFEDSIASKEAPFPASLSRIVDSTAQPATATKPASNLQANTVFNDLRLVLANTATALSIQELSFSTVQAQFEQKETELLVSQQEVAKLTTALANYETKRTGLVSTLSETRQERNTLRKEDNILLKTLTESAVPDIAEYATAKLQAARVEGLESRLASLQRDFEFTRQQYQNASESASALSKELEDAKAANEVLTAKANGSTVQLRQMFEARNIQTAHDELEQLRQQLAHRDRRIEQLEKDKEEMVKRDESRGTARITRSRSPAPRNTLPVPGMQGHHGAGTSGTASALARSAAAMVRAASARSPAGSRAGSRQTSPLKGGVK